MKENSIVLLTILLLGVFTYAGCNLIGQAENTATETDTITIAVNETYRNDNLNFSLKLDSVLSDSRCPNGAECFWEGNAKVKLDLVVEGNYHHQFYLNTSGIFQRDTTIRGINYKLIELLPHPDIHTKYSYDAYRAKILATKQ